MQLIARLMVLSLFMVMVGCNSVPRPDAYVCVINIKALHQKCYNLKTDYDDNGILNPKAVPVFRPITRLEDFDKLISTDSTGWANIKAYIRELRAAN